MESKVQSRDCQTVSQKGEGLCAIERRREPEGGGDGVDFMLINSQ